MSDLVECPSETASNGRDDLGRFGPGNKAARGNPFAKKVAELKAAMLEESTTTDVKEVVRALITKAKEGDVAAAKVYLDRMFGKEVVATIEQAGDGAGGVLVYLPGNVR